MNDFGRKRATRDVILQSIKSTNHATVGELASASSVSPVTVRHHLNALQADGLISAESVRRSVGRPYYVYSLTPKGQELFPKKYFSLSTRLLDELKERFSRDVVEEVLLGVVRGLVAEHRAEFDALTVEERLDFLVQLLTDEGFMAEWEQVEDGYQITEHSCPYVLIGQQHSEICTLDTALIELVMESEVEQHSCVLNGDNCCQFTISPTIPLAEVETS